MLSNETMDEIFSKTKRYWEREVKKPDILSIAKGKEIGHKLADIVDEKTTALLTVEFTTTHQRDARGLKRARSMGDLWLKDEGIYHPINVKTGIVGSEGQPNLVSLKKVLSAIMSRQIDSYYLLIVKMDIQADSIAPSIYFIDMLDWLDCVTFDSGPGQMMLKAVHFFKDYSPRKSGDSDIKAKVQRLMELYESGEKRLRENRERKLDRYKQEFEDFMRGGVFLVTPETQRSLHLE